MSEQEQLLEEMVDRSRILDVILRYCRGIDHCDVELINSAYHSDAEVKYPKFTAVGAEIGPAIIKLVKETSPRKTAMHSIMNHLAFINGNVAKTETYFNSTGLSESEDPELLIENGGRWLDRFEKRDGEWKITDRLVIWDWRRTTEMADLFRNNSGSTPGLCSTDDASYAFLKEIV